MKKYFALMLMLLLPMTLLTACGDDDDDPDSPSSSKNDFELPIMKWGSSPSYIKSHQDGKIIEDPTNTDVNGYTFKLSGGKTWGVCYLFDDRDRLYASAMVIESRYESDYYKWIKGLKFETLFEEDGIEFMYSSKYKDCYLLIEDIYSSDTSYGISGIQAVFIDADLMEALDAKTAEQHPAIKKIYQNREALMKAIELNIVR